MTQSLGVAVVVLAAGSGTRMRSKLMKVLHPLCGRTMVGHVLAAASELAPRRLVVVVGNGREQVGPHVLEAVPDALLAVQETQEGTGHAVRVGVEELARHGPLTGSVVVMAGDTPLIRGETLRALVADHEQAGRAVTVLTGEVPDPFGYGRIVRGDRGDVLAIVEEKDATEAERRIREINSGIYAFDAAFLAEALGRITNDNAKGEYYLTDVVGVAVADGAAVGGHVVADVSETEGANDRAQLADLAARLNRRTLDAWMREGVTVVDPASTWVDVSVTLARDVTLRPGVQLHGSTTVAEDALVGPDCTLTDVTVGPGASVVRTHAERAVVGAGVAVGPWAYLRPGTVLEAGSKVGAYVETKNAVLGPGAKVPHLSYVGDADIGEGSNLGAGTIVANYDGVAKHRTTVGRHVRTGSNNTLVAPVEIGDGAVTGAGTVVREDVPAGALAVSAGPQRTLAGWVLHRRPGSTSAQAAKEAGAVEPDHSEVGVAGPDGRGGQSTSTQPSEGRHA